MDELTESEYCVVLLTDGDTVRGSIGSMSSDSIRMELLSGDYSAYSAESVLEVTKEYVPPSESSPYTAALLSLILPGMGQFYNRDYTKGLLLFNGTFISLLSFAILNKWRGHPPHQSIAENGALQPLLIASGLWLYSILDAWFTPRARTARYREWQAQQGRGFSIGVAPLPKGAAAGLQLRF